MKNIGEQLDYSTLAKLHRPTDPDLLAREAHALAALGFKPRDIAEAYEAIQECRSDGLKTAPTSLYRVRLPGALIAPQDKSFICRYWRLVYIGDIKLPCAHRTKPDH